MENLSFQYPTWYILLCLALGLIYALGLYYKDKTFVEQYPNLHKILGVVRFLSVSLLAFLLLKPLLKSLFTETQKPVVVLAQDVSESVGAAFGEEALTTYQQDWNEMKSALEGKFEVKEYAFGSEVRQGVDFEMNDKVSNLSKVMSEIGDVLWQPKFGGRTAFNRWDLQ